jgi:hypothetical protein
VEEIEQREEEEVNFPDEETLAKLEACTPSVDLGTPVRFSRIAPPHQCRAWDVPEGTPWDEMCEGYEDHWPDNWESTHTVMRRHYVDELHPLLRPTCTVEGVEGLTLEQCKAEGRVREQQVRTDEARCAAVIERLAPRLREQDAAVKKDPPPFLGDPFDGVDFASQLRKFKAGSHPRWSHAMSEGAARVVTAACKRAGMTTEFKNGVLVVLKPGTS